ncbi:MAG: ABC transporter substrate-binding protein, partial [Cupriavidus sp.]|nr:ABC transporter substrate-binding protein [Cupriavidus sp.]
VDTPLNRELVKRTHDKFKANPNYSLAGSYICTKIMVDGMIKAGSADPKAVVAALEGMKYEGLTGPEEIRAADHQVLKNYYLLRGKAKSRMKDKDDYAEIVSVGKAFLPVEQTQCKMA